MVRNCGSNFAIECARAEHMLMRHPTSATAICFRPFDQLGIWRVSWQPSVTSNVRSPLKQQNDVSAIAESTCGNHVQVAAAVLG